MKLMRLLLTTILFIIAFPVQSMDILRFWKQPQTVAQGTQEATQKLQESDFGHELMYLGRFGTWETNNDSLALLKKIYFSKKYKNLINLGADINQPNRSGDYFLVSLIKERATDLFRYLIENNWHTLINPNVQDSHGTTALMWIFLRSFDYEDYVIFRTLLSLRPNVNVPDNRGSTALHYACQSAGTTPYIMALLQAGADPNIADNNGDTALIYCALHNRQPEVIRELLRRGADPNHVDQFGNTALLNATDQRNIPNIKLLFEYGADPFFRGGPWKKTALELWRYYNIEKDIMQKEKLP